MEQQKLYTEEQAREMMIMAIFECEKYKYSYNMTYKDICDSVLRKMQLIEIPTYGKK